MVNRICDFPDMPAHDLVFHIFNSKIMMANKCDKSPVNRKIFMFVSWLFVLLLLTLNYSNRRKNNDEKTLFVYRVDFVLLAEFLTRSHSFSNWISIVVYTPWKKKTATFLTFKCKMLADCFSLTLSLPLCYDCSRCVIENNFLCYSLDIRRNPK